MNILINLVVMIILQIIELYTLNYIFHFCRYTSIELNKILMKVSTLKCATHFIMKQYNTSSYTVEMKPTQF